jgi:hypothetical protein
VRRNEVRRLIHATSEQAGEPKVVTQALTTPTDLPSNAVAAVAKALNGLVADAFPLYLKPRISTGT